MGYTSISSWRQIKAIINQAANMAIPSTKLGISARHDHGGSLEFTRTHTHTYVYIYIHTVYIYIYIIINIYMHMYIYNII